MLFCCVSVNLLQVLCSLYSYVQYTFTPFSVFNVCFYDKYTFIVLIGVIAVSYTHLDVYKRQLVTCSVANETCPCQWRKERSWSCERMVLVIFMESPCGRRRGQGEDELMSPPIMSGVMTSSKPHVLPTSREPWDTLRSYLLMVERREAKGEKVPSRQPTKSSVQRRKREWGTVAVLFNPRRI